MPTPMDRADQEAPNVPVASPEEILAFEIALGRPLRDFPPGQVAFHVFDSSGGEMEGMAEELAPVDLRALGRSAGLEEAEMDALSEEELREAVTDELGEALLGETRDGFPRFAEAPSMLELLRILVERDYIGIDFVGDPEEGEESVSDARLGVSIGEEARYARFKAIKDLRWRRIALALHGEMHLMELVYRYEDVCYCQGILARRPQWELVCAWDAIPHRQDEGSAILRRRD